MSFLHSIILGIIEGVTEFLPVSSTAHLILLSSKINLTQTPFLSFFEVFIQGAAIIAILPLFIQRITKEKMLISIISISFIPTAVVGFLLHKIIKNVFFNELNLISTSLIIIGIAFIIVEQLLKKNIVKMNNNLNTITISHALIIGFAQSFAVIPGVSRAGIVMIIMMLMGYKRSESALYSFYLAVPTILSASLFDLSKTDLAVLTNTENFVMLIVGTIVSLITAFIVVRWFVRFLELKTLIPFAIYRIILGLFFFFK